MSHAVKINHFMKVKATLILPVLTRTTIFEAIFSRWMWSAEQGGFTSLKRTSKEKKKKKNEEQFQARKNAMSWILSCKYKFKFLRPRKHWRWVSQNLDNSCFHFNGRIPIKWNFKFLLHVEKQGGKSSCQNYSFSSLILFYLPNKILVYQNIPIQEIRLDVLIRRYKIAGTYPEFCLFWKYTWGERIIN